MHYAAIVQGEDREVEIVEVAPGRFEITVDGRKRVVDAHAVSDSSMSCLIDDHAYEVHFEANPKGGENLLVRGHIVPVEVIDLRSLRLRRAQAAGGEHAGPAVIASPMSGKIVSVLVKEGQQVRAGDGVVVVEAMKMENELRAPKAGVVQELVAQVGATVDGGARLCVIH